MHNLRKDLNTYFLTRNILLSWWVTLFAELNRLDAVRKDSGITDEEIFPSLDFVLTDEDELNKDFQNSFPLCSTNFMNYTNIFVVLRHS